MRKGWTFSPVYAWRLRRYEPAARTGKRRTGIRPFRSPNHQFAVLEELATQYPVEGVELDFAAAPGGSPFWLTPEDALEYTPVMTDFVRSVAEMVRSRPGGPGQIGVRIYPTLELNRKTGLDVQTWLREGLVDFVVPMVYAFFVLMLTCQLIG